MCMRFMNELRAYLDEVSLLGASAWLGVALLGADAVLTLIHANQERRGRLWRYFGSIAGLHIPDWAGFGLFFVGLTILLWLVGFIGFSGHWPTGARAPAGAAMAFTAALIGARVSDTFFSHVRLDRQGYRPNPGLPSTRYYLLEAVALVVVFSPGLTAHMGFAILGLICGSAAFYVVLPIMRWLRQIDRFRREPWKPGEPMPAWAQGQSMT
jgi:hypothetical protein